MIRPCCNGQTTWVLAHRMGWTLATLTIMSKYEACINGNRAGDAYMAPGWTSYQHRMQYQTCPVTESLKAGENWIEVTLGNGWYKGYLGFDAKPDNYGNRTALPEKEGVICVGSGDYHYEYATATSLDQERFTLDSTLGELVAEDLGRKTFDELAPGMLQTSMIQYAYDMTIAELISMDADGEPLYRAVIDVLNKA